MIASALKPVKGRKLEEDKKRVLEEYFGGTGRVCVSAGAGTGKTTTLIEAVAEVVVEDLQKDPTRNPLERVLIVTFGREASSHLRVSLRKRLKDHEDASGDALPSDVWRWIETESYIQTIDSFALALLGEIAGELHLNLAFEFLEGLDQDTLVDEVLESVRQAHPEEYARLESAYPAEDWSDFPPLTVRNMLWEAFQKSREFCWLVDKATQSLKDSLAAIHAGQRPPFDRDRLSRIVGHATKGKLDISKKDLQKLARFADSAYKASAQAVSDFSVLLKAFDDDYDHRTRREGTLTYVDTSFLVWRYLDAHPDSDWARSLRRRFDHLFIDEFQDTSFLQCSILRHFVRNEPAEAKNRIMVIGDPKQSIYEWRSAEPVIFSSMVQWAEARNEGPDPYLGAEGFRYVPLTVGYRSQPDLVHAANGLFAGIFDDRARGAMGTKDISYVPMEPSADIVELDAPTVHVISLGQERKAEDWTDAEALKIAEAVKGILESGAIKIRRKVGDGKEFVKPEPGDVALLFRRRTFVPKYAKALASHGIQYAVISDSGLFKEPEVSLVIDLLDWFANPHAKNSLIRILRSPLVALDDKTLRYLSSQRYFLSTALRDWPEEVLPVGDRRRLSDLVNLRDDVRWHREGSKSELMSELVQSSGLEVVLLAGRNGLQSFGNLWCLVELVNGWEEEELLSYRDFVERLKALRDRARDGRDEIPPARLADAHSREAVKIMTIHAAKGQEFPIVVLPDIIASAGGHGLSGQRLIADRIQGMALRPVTGDADPPTGVQIPGPGGKWMNPNSRGGGLLWVSDTRKPDGTLKYVHPLNGYVEDRVREFWRLLYVAMTRAKDHLVLSMNNETPHGGRLTTWMPALREGWFGGSVPRRGPRSIVLSWKGPDGKETNVKTRFDIGGLPTGKAEEAKPYTGIKLTPAAVEQPKPTRFLPRRLNPSSLHHLLECPLRYQLAVLQRVSEVRGSFPPGSRPPAGLNPYEWGDIVHETMELLLQDSPRLGQHLARLDPPVREELQRNVLDRFWASDIGRSIRQAQAQKLRICPEFEMMFPMQVDGGQVIMLEGKTDLLFEEAPSEWTVVDFKTGAVPDGESYLLRHYELQVNAYAWLLNRVYGIVPRKGILVFLHPVLQAYDAQLEPEKFKVQLTTAIEGISALTGPDMPAHPEPSPNGKIAEPPEGSRCGTCPYAKGVGGPCKFW